jgi:hypothetical protein
MKPIALAFDETTAHHSAISSLIDFWAADRSVDWSLASSSAS